VAWLILLIVAWGALAFGAIYDWARWPLLIACVVAGAWGLVRTDVPRERRIVNGPILAGLMLVALAVSIQLVPLERTTLRRWSPATHAFLMQYDIVYAMASAASDLSTKNLRDGGVPFDFAQDRKTPPLRSEDANRGAEAPRLRSENADLTHPLSIDPPKTWLGLGMLAGLGFMLLGLARGINGRDLRLFAPGIVALGVLMSMIGIVQKALWSGKVYGFWEPVNKGVVAFGPFVNRNHFAGWMLLALPVAVGYFASLVTKGMVGVKPGWRNRVI
jgi:hypothetical protein